MIEENPYQFPHEFERLTGELKGYISRRIDIKNRLVYHVNEETKTIDILSFLTHYQDIK